MLLGNHRFRLGTSEPAKVQSTHARASRAFRRFVTQDTMCKDCEARTVKMRAETGKSLLSLSVASQGAPRRGRNSLALRAVLASCCEELVTSNQLR